MVFPRARFVIDEKKKKKKKKRQKDKEKQDCVICHEKGIANEVDRFRETLEREGERIGGRRHREWGLLEQQRKKKGEGEGGGKREREREREEGYTIFFFLSLLVLLLLLSASDLVGSVVFCGIVDLNEMERGMMRVSQRRT